MKIILIIITLVSGLAVILASHYFLYSTAVKFFDISDKKIKLIISVLLSILSVSFILASIMVHWMENVITRNFYLVAGIWLGWLTLLLIACLLLWLLFILSKPFGMVLNFKIIAAIFFAISFFVTAYSIVNAKRIVIKEIEVFVKNLPAQWENKVLLQVSDVHLGAINGTSFITEIVQTINQLEPEAVFITGDYFDGMDGLLDDFVEPLNNINAPQGIYFITGNHETYLGVDKVKAALSRSKIVLMDDKMIDLDGLALIGINHPVGGEKKDLADIIKANNPKKPIVLLYHIPKQIEQAKDAGVDLMLSGQTGE